MAEALLLTPYFQTEVGIVFYRIPPSVSPSAFGERTLLQPAPTELATVKSDQVADFSSNSTACESIAAFAKSAKVRKKLNERDKRYGELPYQRFVKQLQVCQCRDGQYCHHEKTQVETENGLVQLCWHHDKVRMEGGISAARLAQLADENWTIFVSQAIRQTLRKADGVPLDYADLVLFACIKGLGDELDDDELQQFFGYPPKPDIGGTTKESSIGFDKPYQNAKASLQTYRESLKLRVEPEPLAAFMAIPKLQRFEWRKWLQFVKSQPCVCCGQRADDPHHIIGYGGKMGSKQHDLFVIPLCRIHHDELHRNVGKFEQDYGSQLELLIKFLDRALGLGALEVDG